MKKTNLNDYYVWLSGTADGWFCPYCGAYVGNMQVHDCRNNTNVRPNKYPTYPDPIPVPGPKPAPSLTSPQQDKLERLIEVASAALYLLEQYYSDTEHKIEAFLRLQAKIKDLKSEDWMIP